MASSALAVQIKGVAGVLKAFNKYEKELTAQANEGVIEAARFLKGEVVYSIAGQRDEKRSVDTGFFKSNIYHRLTKFMTSEVYTNVPYSIYLEKGTRYIGARGHFMNSLERNREKINDILRKRIKRLTFKSDYKT